MPGRPVQDAWKSHARSSEEAHLVSGTGKLVPHPRNFSSEIAPVPRQKPYLCPVFREKVLCEMKNDSNRFSRALLAWYRDNKRSLPWRETRDPYLIWVSEIILQQTRVAQGYDYYARFVSRFPDVRSLAEADEEEVMRYWQGLGYYSRARNLHAAARSMAGGVFPKTYASVRALKGVGDYTAAAICSFAYDMPCAVVDGNVYRVLSRYLGVDTPIDSTEGKKTFAALAREMLDADRPADYNQAIMDFGALVCTPQSPACLLCPLADSCAALASGRVTQLPVKQHKTKQTDRYLNYLFVRMGDDTLIRKRTGDDIWKNLFELPLLESDRNLSADEFLASSRLASFLAGHPGAVVRPLQREVKHVLSHRILHVHFYEVRLPADTAPFDGYLRVPLSDLESYAWPRLLHAFFEKLQKKDSDICMV